VEVQKRFEELTGARLAEGYGLSEASPLTHASPLVGVRKAGSIGVPVPCTDARIVDPLWTAAVRELIRQLGAHAVCRALGVDAIGMRGAPRELREGRWWRVPGAPAAARCRRSVHQWQRSEGSTH
jgi:long-subunit acyl-CoA synthetase (AMP-forming)